MKGSCAKKGGTRGKIAQGRGFVKEKGLKGPGGAEASKVQQARAWGEQMGTAFEEKKKMPRTNEKTKSRVGGPSKKEKMGTTDSEPNLPRAQTECERKGNRESKKKGAIFGLYHLHTGGRGAWTGKV